MKNKSTNDRINTDKIINFLIRSSASVILILIKLEEQGRLTDNENAKFKKTCESIDFIFRYLGESGYEDSPYYKEDDTKITD